MSVSSRNTKISKKFQFLEVKFSIRLNRPRSRNDSDLQFLSEWLTE